MRIGSLCGPQRSKRATQYSNPHTEHQAHHNASKYTQVCHSVNHRHRTIFQVSVIATDSETGTSGSTNTCSTPLVSAVDGSKHPDFFTVFAMSNFWQSVIELASNHWSMRAMSSSGQTFFCLSKKKVCTQKQNWSLNTLKPSTRLESGQIGDQKWTQHPPNRGFACWEPLGSTFVDPEAPCPARR